MSDKRRCKTTGLSEPLGSLLVRFAPVSFYGHVAVMSHGVAGHDQGSAISSTGKIFVSFGILT